MKTQHTPGPWMVSERNQGDIGSTTRVEIWGDGNRIALAVRNMRNPSKEIPLKNARANARLIAAAPDLLAAAKDALDELLYWNSGMDDDSAANPTTPDAIKQLRAVIAKTEGND